MDRSKGVQSDIASYQKLGPAQSQVLDLLVNQKLTPKQIALKRRTTKRAVYKILEKLKKKGFIDSYFSGGSILSTPVNIDLEVTKNWRLHNLHFVIKPYYFYPRYHKIRKEKGNYGIRHRDWTIKFHTDTIEMQLQDWAEFSDTDKWKTIRQAEQSFNRALREISQRYGFEVWKEKKCNIRMVNHHLARNPSEIADARHGKYLFIKGKDGKIWFTIDKSKGAEHEYQHPERALTDSEKVEPYFNDLLYNEPPTNSQLSLHIGNLTGSVDGALKVMDHLDKNLKTHFRVLSSIESAVLKLTQAVQKDRVMPFLSQPSGRLQSLSSLILDSSSSYHDYEWLLENINTVEDGAKYRDRIEALQEDLRMELAKKLKEKLWKG